MIQLIKVTIANRMDDSLRSIVLVCDSEDTDALAYNIRLLSDSEIDLSDYTGEYVHTVQDIKPINISTEKGYAESIDNLFNL